MENRAVWSKPLHVGFFSIVSRFACDHCLWRQEILVLPLESRLSYIESVSPVAWERPGDPLSLGPLGADARRNRGSSPGKLPRTVNCDIRDRERSRFFVTLISVIWSAFFDA